MLLALLGVNAALAQDVLINEIVYDPDGSDSTDTEWVELCNAGSSTVDLTGWSIQAAGSEWDGIFTFPAVSIAPGEYLLVGGGFGDLALSGTMQNGGSATDGVRLVDDAAAVIDTLLYDEPNDNGLTDDSGAAGVSFGPDVSSGHSLARLPDCTDTDASGVDLVELSAPTPGAENVDDGGGGDTGGGGGGDADCSVRTVTINEFMPDPASDGGDDGHEWIEVYNHGDATVDLSGWELVNRKSDASSKTIGLPADTLLAPGAFLVLGEEFVEDADVIVDLDMGNDSSSIDTVELFCNDNLIDLAAYGGDNDLGWLNEDGVTSTVAARPGSGWTLGRDPDGADTNDSAVDFVAFEYATPGTTNADSGEGPCEGSDDVVINEFIPNPAKPDGADEEDPEWVELYNVGTAAVDLDGWALRYGTSPDGWKTVDISELGFIEPGQHLVVGEEGAPNVDLIVEIDMGAASSNADGLQLRHCGPGTADTVIYGDPNEDGWVDDTDGEATLLAPGPGDGDTLQRVEDGYDTDDNSVDWVISDSPSPGEPNPEVAPTICTPGDGSSIKVNEIFPDPEGTDSEAGEWIELYNAGSAAVSLDGWVVETGTSSWDDDFTFPGGVSLAPGDFLVVGNPPVPVADYTSSSLSLGNASTAPDGVRIVDCDGTVQDTMLYGKEGEDPEDSELTDDAGFQAFAPWVSDSNLSIGRFPDGADTDDSSVDFETDMAPTPGEPNGSGGGEGGDDDGPGDDIGKSCGGDKSSSGGKKCAAFGPLGGLELALAGLVLIRRRRR